MKKLLSLLVLFAVLQTVIAQDNNPKFEKKKTYSKSYPVSASDKINLTNSFGEMKLITWEKNEVKVDADISTGSDDEARAQESLDRISIEDGKNGNGVFFKTKMANQDKNWDKDEKKNYRNERMKINYTVYLPANSPLDAENSFGPMIVPDYRGEATIESKFGSLTAGKITNAKRINVEFGKANIATVNGGTLNIKFSKGNVEKLSGDVDANVEFCGNLKLGLSNELKDLSLKNSHSTLYLDADKNLSASFDIGTSFGDFDNRTSFNIKETSNTDRHNNSAKYSGNAGSGSNKIKLTSSFGHITLGHDLKVDMTDTSKTKTKTRRE